MRLNAGVLRTNYRKTVAGSDLADNKLDTSAWLYNISGAYALGRAIEIYGGYSRGLEEAGVAPASSPNRYEVLPPAAARQIEMAAIFRPAKNFKVIIGAFDLQRGYFGANPDDGHFSQLGRVRHRGIELSAAGALTNRLTAIVGGVLLDPIVKSSASKADLQPIGVPKIRLLASADYRFVRDVHVDTSVQFTGSRQATLGGSVAGQTVPTSLTVNVGLRSPLRLGKAASTVRLQVLNLLNDFSWDVNSGGTMTYSPSRRMRLALTTEF